MALHTGTWKEFVDQYGPDLGSSLWLEAPMVLPPVAPPADVPASSGFSEPQEPQAAADVPQLGGSQQADVAEQRFGHDNIPRTYNEFVIEYGEAGHYLWFTMPRIDASAPQNMPPKTQSPRSLQELMADMNGVQMMYRPCVDCGRRTGSFCDTCKAIHRIPSECWASSNQHTPLCTTCDKFYLMCHYCRGLSWTRPFAWGG